MNININIKHLKEILMSKLGDTTEYKGEIVESIIDSLLTTEKGIGNLYLSFNGLKDKIEDLNYQIGDTVIIKTESISIWSWDIALMKEKQIILNDTIECKIIGFNKEKERNLKVSYNCIKSSSKVIIDDYHIRVSHIVKLK
jgi:hypothetical protein